ncbi:MAG TPA: hypothetical protein VIU61_29400 [Kofleriaceae bacterium]
MKLTALVLALVLAGCSFAMTRSSPRNAKCSSYVPAVVDTAITTALLALAVRSHRENACHNRLDGCHRYDPTPLYIAPILLFAASGVWGYSGAHACRLELAKSPARPAAPVVHSTPAQPPP